jgi:viroplasmin and RNaseH domain-containing protein
MEIIVSGDKKRTRFMKQKYYAYFIPGNGAEGKTGITDAWKKTEAMVSGKPGARFKAFETKHDAEAWLAQGAMYEAKPVSPRLQPGIYFDAGTGRGQGVEVSVTDEKGKNLLHKAIPKEELNRFGKQLVGDSAATNNYGELLALRYALEIANADGIKKIFGDSKLVIEFWSQWRIKRKELPEETVALADEVSKMREDFEADGGVVERISGDHNPADLGFHR